MTTRPRRSPPAKRTPTQPERVSDSKVDLTSQADSGSPPMPHERDEKSGMTGGVQNRRVQQAHKDLERGVEDTSRGPEADAAYRKLK